MSEREPTGDARSVRRGSTVARFGGRGRNVRQLAQVQNALCERPRSGQQRQADTLMPYVGVEIDEHLHSGASEEGHSAQVHAHIGLAAVDEGEQRS